MLLTSFVAGVVHFSGLIGQTEVPAGTISVLMWVLAIAAVLIFGPMLIGLRYIPNDRVGVVEKLWSPLGSIKSGHFIAFDGEAGLPGEPAARRRAPVSLALAVPHSQGCRW